MYWLGPILGGLLAAGFYEYLYCPDPEIKKRMQQIFKKTPSGTYKEVETEDLGVKSVSGHNIDLEKAEKKELFHDSTGEVLSSV